ncbi:MAG: chalcone isomerase family protein [Planctomycetota bacterium]
MTRSTKNTVPWTLAVLLGAATWLGPEPARAADEEFPPTRVIADKVLLRNGVGLCEWGMFAIDLYRAALYLERVSSDAAEVLASEQVKRIELVFSRDLSRSQMQRAYRAAFAANAGDGLSALADRIDRLCEWLSSVRAGDRVTFTCVPGSGVQVEIRGERLGTLTGDDFARATVALYIGAHPPDPQLKRGLLGEHPRSGRAAEETRD